MTTFVTLLLAHLIGDFPLQTNKIFTLKTKGIWGLILHVAIHLLVAGILLQNPLTNWPILAILGIAHFSTDWVKLRYPSKSLAMGFITDQLIHIVTIFIISLFVPNLGATLPMWAMVPAMLLGFIPAFLMFGWIWAIQLKQENRVENAIIIEWASCKLLPASQWFGQSLILALLFIRVVPY